MASYPPLLGDDNGRYRVCVVGNSGSGKTRTASALAKLLGVPFLSLDTFFWKPGWKQTPHDEMRDSISVALEECKNGWVIDSNYELAQEQATDIIWLDPPLALYLPRLILRTFRRLIGVEPPCSPGCYEKFSEVFFSKRSIIWWCITHHGVVRRKNEAKMERFGLSVGRERGGKMRRIGGWGSEYKRWMFGVSQMMKTRQKND